MPGGDKVSDIGPHQTKNSLIVLVIGSTGHGGSYLCVELVDRGHRVTGLARQPQKLGTRALYTPKQFDVEKASFGELIEVLKGYDVVVNEFSPHSQGHEALTSMPFVEITRKLVRAAKFAEIDYLIMVGGAGSLELPHIEPHLCAGETGYFWRAFRQAFADSESHAQYMEERLGPLGTGLRKLRNARLKVFDGLATHEDREFMCQYLDIAFKGDYSMTFVKAARLSYMFFEGSNSWNWSHVSPPARYRPCAGGEPYEISYDILPLDDQPRPEHYQGWYKDDPKDIEGRMKGISLIGFSKAIVDDVETKFGLHKHWTATTALKDDTPYPSYVNFDLGFKPRTEYEKVGR